MPADRHLQRILDPQAGLVLVDVRRNVTEKASPRESSREAVATVALVAALCELGVRPEEVGVVAPYRAQVALIRRQLDSGMWAGVPTTDPDSGRREALLVTDFSQVPAEAERVIFWPRATGGADRAP